MARVLIIGASRGIGLEATRQALDRGYAVRAMARSADRIPVKGDALEMMNGSALDAVDVTTALDGVSAVVLSLGVAVRPDVLVGPVTLFSQATRIIVPAMERAGVRRLICVTGFGAGDSRASLTPLERVPFRLLLGRIYDDKSIQERTIRDSGLEWVIARPGLLTNGPRTSRYKVLKDPASWRNGLISRADVADYLVRQIEDDTFVGTAPVLIRY